MRKQDTGWRDELLGVRHISWGFQAPAPGLTLPMIEYDRGEPLALISYQSRAWPLPKGAEVAATYRAFGALYREDGPSLPFLTARYDTSSWAFQVIAHNPAARDFLDRDGWVSMTERQFVSNLYRLRGRHAPDLAPYGVDFSDTPWPDDSDPVESPVERWRGQLMSTRRRNYEPVAQVRPGWRNPCVDVDFAVIDRNDRVAAVVDYKAPGARIGLGSTNVRALSRLRTDYGRPSTIVPAFVVRYEPDRNGWRFAVHCANAPARNLLAYALGATDGRTEALAETIAGTEWTDLLEAEWVAVLKVAREL